MGFNVELVVFDMAGTTVSDRTQRGEEAVAGALRAAMAGAGVTCTPAQANEVMGLPKPVAIGLLIQSAGRQADLGPSLAEIHTDFVRRMLDFYRTDPGVQPLPGTLPTFRRLRDVGIKIALDTGFSRDIADVVLQRLGWLGNDVVDATITSDEVDRGRPHPDMIRALMKRFGITDPARVVKVGDTPSDLAEGTAAGCGFVVGVCSGSHTQDQLKACPHTHVLASVADLPAVLGL